MAAGWCVFATIIFVSIITILYLTEIHLELRLNYSGKKNTLIHKLVPNIKSDEMLIKEKKHCIESNICNPNPSKSLIYYYNRTGFYALLHKPVNTSANTAHTDPVVPRVVHFVLYSDPGTEFKFYYMISLMAIQRFVKPEKILFWHDNLPIGEFWEETKRRVRNMYFVRRERPDNIYGRPIKVLQHVSDIVRLEALLEYGGMYFDTDAIVVNPIDDLLKYDVTMGVAVPGVNLANGILFSKPWSDFFKIWHSEYKEFNDDEWGTTSVIKPFHIFKLYPNLIHVEETSLCRPNWSEMQYLVGHLPWDFKRKNYVIHLYMNRGSGRGKNPIEIKNWDCTVGRVMRYIYFSQEL